MNGLQTIETGVYKIMYGLHTGTHEIFGLAGAMQSAKPWPHVVLRTDVLVYSWQEHNLVEVCVTLHYTPKVQFLDQLAHVGRASNALCTMIQKITGSSYADCGMHRNTDASTMPCIASVSPGKMVNSWSPQHRSDS